MRRNLVVGNWKMHGNIKSNQLLLESLTNGLHDLKNSDYVVCVPNPYLFQARALLENTNIAWGGQNVTNMSKVHLRVQLPPICSQTLDAPMCCSDILSDAIYFTKIISPLPPDLMPL